MSQNKNSLHNDLDQNLTAPSEFDERYFPIQREWVTNKRKKFIDDYINNDDVLCDIGNQGKDVPRDGFYKLITLDITPSSKPDIVADITKKNSNIDDEAFDGLLCTEVLEHVVDPFAAVNELHRILRPGGYLFVTVPCNTRIHGPIPDCWRFTEFGLRILFRNFELIEIDRLDTPNRSLFPLHYSVIIKKYYDRRDDVDPRSLKFEPVS